MATPTNNVAPTKTIEAAIAFFKADATLIAKRTALGDAFAADGVQLATDFKAGTAKDAGREDRFRAMQYIAQESMPDNVKAALRDADVAGAKAIKADGVTLTKTEWSKRIPGKIVNMQNAFALYLKETTDGEKKGASKNAPRDIADRIKDEIAKLKKAVSTDKDAESPTAKFDHTEMLAAFQRALDLAK